MTTTPAPPSCAYVLTPSELREILEETCRMAREYYAAGACDTWEQCGASAAAEMLGRLEAEREVPER